MKRISRNKKTWIYFLIRKKYQEKRNSFKWKKRKKNKSFDKKRYYARLRKNKRAPFIQHKAPNLFSFINNTNEVLKYFNEARKIFKDRKNINFDISEVSELTPDTIAILVASIKDPKFIKTGSCQGNAPLNKDLNKIFTESGFNEHISHSNGFKKSKKGNLLHKEVDRKVAEKTAKNACILGMDHVYNTKKINPVTYPISSSLYEILIECMSNTHNHANLSKQGECRWWLYVYNNPKTKSTCYSFVDLGVGIFGSHYTHLYKKILKIAGLKKNIDLVDDLLEGKINSRIEKDRELRGKGIPQIVKHSKNSFYRSFYIITNNVKINLTNGEREQLDEDFYGTFLHWELIKE